MSLATKQYQSISYISGPLLFLEGARDLAYSAIVNIHMPDGGIRGGQVIEVSERHAVIQVFEDFAYHRQLVSDDGLSVVLEFSARVGERELKGIDLVRFDTDGLIVDFEVMVRPMSGLQALGDQMARRLAAADKN